GVAVALEPVTDGDDARHERRETGPRRDAPIARLEADALHEPGRHRRPRRREREGAASAVGLERGERKAAERRVGDPRVRRDESCAKIAHRRRQTAEDVRPGFYQSLAIATR